MAGPNEVLIGAQYVDLPVSDPAFFLPTDFAVLAEQAGFDSVWCGDHVIDHFDGIATLAAMASVTRRVALGTAVTVLPLRAAAVTAKGVATAAVLAGGRRTIMGVDIGGDIPAEIELCGTPMPRRAAYSDEALDVITRLWSGAPVSYAGRSVTFDEIQMRQLPPRRPEILVGGRAPSAMRRAVAFGDGYLPYLVDPDQARSRFTQTARLAAEAGRDLTDFTFGIATWMVAAASVAEAAESIAAQDQGFRGVDRARLERFYVLGTADDCFRKLAAFVEAGANHLLLGCHPGNALQLDSYMETMATVLPRLRHEVASGLGRPARESLSRADQGYSGPARIP
jgi:alkanesulfonate monooxygenase SsuD/methylene tetrahydromethanopterin reductase-like flavin-dependent oxidoreductase (luciferase family)